MNLFKGEADDVDQESQEAKDLLHGPFTSARPKKINDKDGNMDNGMVLKSKERLPSCSQFVQFARINQGNKLEASAGTELGRPHPTKSGRSHPTTAGRVRLKKCQCNFLGGILLFNLFF
ncbi:hypothetical protein M9H77_03329 [Catharanthus roseus]|uniref:Uncharacterized protein n=1 Tax=Catharanthus roseus TaxID=4058 RepID=A0ACC0CAY9_CATRO|nr:hypothetical protein M9H77_03329 [Catharanthus roseus]